MVFVQVGEKNKDWSHDITLEVSLCFM